MATTKRLDKKVAIVTASTQGIGYAIAERFAENGARVVVSSRKQENVDKAVKSLKQKGFDVIGLVCDVVKKQDREALLKMTIDTYGRLDILISNAAYWFYGPFLKTPEKEWDKIFDVNLKSGFLLAKEALPYLEASKGSMLFMSSVGGYTGSSFIGAYCITKAAMLSLVKMLSQECAPMGVRVNGIAPGLIRTNLSKNLTGSEVYMQSFRKQCPMERPGEPSEIAGAAVFFSSDDASYITGETMLITGGLSARL